MQKVLRILVITFITSIVLAILTAIVCKFFDMRISGGLSILGAISILVGLASFFGSSGRDALFDNYFKPYENPKDAEDRIRMNIGLIDDSCTFAAVSSTAGCLLLVLGLYLR